MQKIMFSDKYGLTQAVIEGRKTMTRRIIKGKWFWERCPEGMWTSDKIKAWEKECEQRLIDLSQTEEWEKAKEWALSHIANYKIGDIVAVAQSYKDIIPLLPADENGVLSGDLAWAAFGMSKEPGYNNKMFVRSDLMSYQIKITDIKVERLQDISDDDCLKEGIYEDLKDAIGMCVNRFGFDDTDNPYGHWYNTPKEAFASIIDKTSGKGTWNRNQLVFAYTFELVELK